MRIILLIAVLITAQTSLFASYKEALGLFQAGNYSASLKMIANELDAKKDMEPDSPNYNLRFLAAHDHWKLGNLQPATAHFKRCMEIRKDSVDPLIDISLLLLDFKKYGDSGYYADQALKKNESSMAYYVHGKISLSQGNFLKAKEYFEKANSLDPGLSISYNSLGIALMRLSKYSEANTAFSTARALTPQSGEILNNIAVSSESLGRFKEALNYYQKASKLNRASEIQANIKRVEKRLESAGNVKGETTPIKSLDAY